MASVGLCIITKELTDDLTDRLVALKGMVDHIYVQENAPRPAASVGKLLSDWIHISHFKWCDDFAAARNALQAEVKTDFWLWMDTDDELINPENIRKVVDYMDTNNIDMMYAPYQYHFNTDGVCDELQNRERIIRTSLPGAWHGVIHETWIPEGPAVRETTDQVVWRHTKDKDGHEESMLRNRAILEKAFATDKPDPRIAYYLGLNYGMDKHYREAIECFRYLIEHGGWDEERYRAWLQIFSCYFELDDYANALNAALQATLELPEWPDAYFMLQQLYYTTDDHQKALEWYHVGASKSDPKTDSARNPVAVKLQPMWLAAYSYMCIGEPSKALAVAVEADKLDPTYGKTWTNLKVEIIRAVNEERAVTNAKALIEFAEKYDNAEVARNVLDSLPPSLRQDPRLTAERRRLIPGKTWPKGSVAYFCGPSFESWGPDTLDKGMGGSEEAVVYLSRELAKLGQRVTVYNQRDTSFADWIQIPHTSYAPTANMADERVKELGTTVSVPGVSYTPWTDINPNDQFDVFIAWRDPSGLRDIKARLKLCDVHDIISQELVYDNLPHVDKYLFKSQFHRSLYPEVPDDKAVVIGNGLSKEHFA